jgi:hypothetical protein
MNRTGLILGLDLAPTKSGFAIFDSKESGVLGLIKYGLIKDLKPSPLGFPFAAIDEVDAMTDEIQKLVLSSRFDYVVMEQSNLGKQRMHQKQIEWLHLAVSKMLVRVLYNPLVQIHFIDSSAWRSTLNLRLDKNQRKNNAKLSKAKKEAAELGTTINKKELGVNGKITWKHLSVERVNNIYNLGFKIKDNDTADAINLTEAFCLGAPTNKEL